MYNIYASVEFVIAQMDREARQREREAASYQLPLYAEEEPHLHGELDRHPLLEEDFW